MAVPAGICCVCNTAGPLTALSTLGDGSELGLCYSCGVDRERLRTFLAHFVAASKRRESRAGQSRAAAD